MELSEYIEQCKKELTVFEQKWISENKKDSENWPMDMAKAEWDEQFLLITVNFEKANRT